MNPTYSGDDSSQENTPEKTQSKVLLDCCPGAPPRGKKVSRMPACRSMPRRLNFVQICPPAPRKSKYSRKQKDSRLSIVVPGGVIRSMRTIRRRLDNEFEFTWIEQLIVETNDMFRQAYIELGILMGSTDH